MDAALKELRRAGAAGAPQRDMPLVEMETRLKWLQDRMQSQTHRDALR